MEWLAQQIMMIFAIFFVIAIVIIGIAFCVTWIAVVLAVYEKWFEEEEKEEASYENTHRPWIKESKNHDR